MLWLKGKQSVKTGQTHKAGARTREALEEALAAALSAVTHEDAAGWFAHCGYEPQGQPL